jgi:hypothetical protein
VGSTTKRVRERERRGGDRESEELSAVGRNDPRGREEDGG